MKKLVLLTLLISACSSLDTKPQLMKSTLDPFVVPDNKCMPTCLETDNEENCQAKIHVSRCCTYGAREYFYCTEVGN